MRFLLPLLCAGLLGAQDPGTSYHFRVPLPLSPAVQQWLEQECDLGCGHANGGAVDVIVAPEQLLAFQRHVTNATLVDRGRPYHELEAVHDAPPDPGYFTVAEVVQEIDQLVATYPTLASKVDLTALPGAAKTHNGQSIWALKVSDNVAQDEDEPVILIASQHHARELNSTYMVIGAMRRVLQGYATDPALQQVVDGHELWFVPCVNPDGTDHVWNVDNFWRKNRRNNGSSYGVDNNRNYPFRWGACGASTTASSETYRGPSAGSEPETKTMMAAQAALRPMLYLDFHSYGQDVLFSYSPCTTPHATITTFLTRYVDDLRNQMTFSSRAPSGSGEAPEWHWAAGGTLSFLTEIGTDFQPAFTATQAEEARVWPGIRRALTSWRPALQGHVRSIQGGQPLAATITFTPALLTLGEVTNGRARDGRYNLWLPLGTYQVTFTAAGHRPLIVPVTVTAYDAPQLLDVELVPTWTDATLSKQGSDRIGTTTTFTYTSTGDAGAAYWVAMALGDTPGIRVGSRTVGLNADALLFASAVPGRLLTSNVGVLPPSEQVNAAFPIPPLATLVGLKLWAAGLTLDTAYVGALKKFSTSVLLTVQP